MEFRSRVYGVSEQIEFFSLRNSFSLFWSPHYNVPIAYRGKLLVTIHDLNHLHLKAWHKRAYAELMFGIAKRRAGAILANSEFTANEIVSRLGVERKRIVVTTLGVDEFWYAKESSQSPHPKPYLLYVGNVKPHKNLVRLLEAFKTLSAQMPHDLVIAGQTDGFITGDEIVKQRARDLGDRVRFTGAIEDTELKRWYAHAALLVFPSLYEGFGLPSLEAMACGCPVTAARASAVPEVCGEAALYFDPYDITDMSSKIRRAIEDNVLREELRARGAERARLFRWESCADTTAEVVRELMRN